MKLAELKVGESAEVRDVAGKGALRRRLALGFGSHRRGHLGSGLGSCGLGLLKSGGPHTKVSIVFNSAITSSLLNNFYSLFPV